MANNQRIQCWVCGSTELTEVKPSSLRGNVVPEDFRITDSRYGTTLGIWRCAECGFLECPEDLDLVALYKSLQDPGYEEGRQQRALQQRKLLELIPSSEVKGRLLDIGAGSGMLVGEAIELGYTAEGVEPSEWLQRRAAELGVPVVCGTFPHPSAIGPYDVVTIIDVIEHVHRPASLLSEVREVLGPGGLMLLVTPDVKSLIARAMGWRWWHFRVAHVGYFDRKTIRMLIERSGFEILSLGRPGWFFQFDYLVNRLNTYLPVRLPIPAFAAKWTVPLNLGDSMYVVCRKI